MTLVVLAAVLAVLAAVLFAQLRASRAREAVLEATRARQAAEGERLRERAAALEGELEAARAVAARHRRLVEQAGDWIWETDADGVLTYSNPAGAELLGAGELVGRSAVELTHPDDQPAVIAPEGFAGVIRRRHADGTWRTLDTRSAALPDGGWRGIDRDLTAPAPPAPAPAPERPGVAIVRWPVVDGRREVVGYELVGAGDVLDGFAPEELQELGGGRPVWIAAPEDPERLAGLAPDRTVLQLAPGTPDERARRLREAGFGLALDGLDGDDALLEHCGIVKVHTRGREDDELRALIARPAERGLVLVATGVASTEEFTRCRVLGFSHFQGEFFARPRGEGGEPTGALASLQTLAELTGEEGSFEELERTIGADVGLSLALLRYVNSAFFALPREIDSVREALALLGTRAVRRWATVVALSAVPDAPDQLVALALLRARMCELLGGDSSEEDRDRLFTVGLFSVADALLDAPMETILRELPFSEDMTSALLRYEGRKGRILATTLRYEQGHFPEIDGDPLELAQAYLTALKWADDAGRWVG
ncbi:HDOD domain-containing protein [Candidatus Solirubrobacter pratensis]|uniref:HDOD domain-containing protein n=1 Tax=Candidatus Solirubrobacter pratensis TaxID=1298857 RepID=UPI0018CBD245|nr:HDOD domain-containing protein [Candidatus Solirubrobacter pratensis]